jgi:hypothetical protein
VTHIFIEDIKKAAYRQLDRVGMAPEVFTMREGHLWENVFVMSEVRAARPDAAVELEVSALAMGYDDENDKFESRG